MAHCMLVGGDSSRGSGAGSGICWRVQRGCFCLASAGAAARLHGQRSAIDVAEMCTAAAANLSVCNEQSVIAVLPSPVSLPSLLAARGKVHTLDSSTGV